MGESKNDVLQGTLDLMVLKTLAVMGEMHGFAIARRIEQISQGSSSKADLSLNQGTIYPALLRLQQAGCITATWGLSENNRRAKFYAITRAGRKQLAVETKSWERVAATMARILAAPKS